MATQPGFLSRLGLAEDADERQVRRAYARELKQIDQERDLEGFQHLRACYEAALDWAARRAAGAAPAPVPAPVPVPMPASVPAEAGAGAVAEERAETQAEPHAATPPAPQAEPRIHPAALGDGVFADFRARMTELAAAPERAGREEGAGVAPWTAALREALVDPRLLHLYARVVFEHRIAALLAGGWRPGHHLLLPAAVEIFNWDHDRSALARLGQAGALLDAALEQRAMFLSQDILVRTQQREVLALLRQGQAPDERTVRGYMVPLVTLMNYFPTLLGVVAPQDVAVAWRARITDDALRSVGPGAGGRKRTTWKFEMSPRWAVGVGIFLLIRLLSSLGPHETPHYSEPSHGFPRLDGTRQHDRPPRPKEIYEDVPVTAERIEAIRRLIDYRPGKDVPPGEQAVEFQVLLDANDTVLGMNKLRTPGDPTYAAAVEKAIRATGPFPPHTARVFRIGFRVDVKRRSVAQAGHDLDLPPVTPERMAEIRRRIDYRPDDGAPPGEQRVRFRVTLGDDGVIRSMKAVAMPADPAYAEAVERAIRSTGPFPPETARTFFIGFHTVVRKPAGAT
jgi:protein TonB